MDDETAIIEEELVYGALRRERLWQRLGLLGLIFGILGCLSAAAVAILDVDPPPVVVPYDPATGSDRAAQASLRQIWNSANADYPPTVYGPNARLDVEILSINLISNNRATVRLRKRLTSLQGVQAGLFTATLLFEFRPEESRSIDQVWTNPFGFTVVEYSIRSDRLEN